MPFSITFPVTIPAFSALASALAAVIRRVPSPLQLGRPASRLVLGVAIGFSVSASFSPLAFADDTVGTAASDADSTANSTATHDTLVVFTWDEGYDLPNSIPTMFVGPMIRAGRYSERIDHFNVLRTLEDLYGLAPTGKAANAAPITDVWR